MRTTQEVMNEIANVQHEKMFQLYDRWNDEKEYENFNNYVGAFKGMISEVYKGSKRPFGFSAKCSDGDIKVSVKVSKNNYKLAFVQTLD